MSVVHKSSGDDIEVKDRLICLGCIGEKYLRAEIGKGGLSNTCYYCGKNGKTISIEEIADRIETALESHYERTSTEPSSFEYAIINDSESNSLYCTPAPIRKTRTAILANTSLQPAP